METVNQDINIRTEEKVKNMYLAYIINTEERSNVQFITYNCAVYHIRGPRSNVLFYRQFISSVQ